MKDDNMHMAWNEPGKGGDKNPWGKNNNNNNDGPPDLDKVFSDLGDKVKKMFNGGGRRGNGSGGGDSAPKGFGLGIGAIFLVLFVLYLASGFYIVKPAEQAAVTRFGKYSRTLGQGPHWLLPIVEKRQIVNTERVQSSAHRGSMLTKDENYVETSMEVQYRINDIENYLFNVFDPLKSLRQAADSALRQVIGNTKLQAVLTIGKAKIADDIATQLRETLKRYDIGISIVAVNFNEAKPPSEVKSAFDDVIQAREERERLQYEAQAYANKILPEARGEAQRMLVEAQAYKESLILSATGDIKRFDAMLAEYKNAPLVTKKRLYIDTIEQVLGNSTKMLIDVNSGNNLIYLPVDKIMNQGSPKNNNSSVSAPVNDTQSNSSSLEETISVPKTIKDRYQQYRRRMG